ncbi:cytochrome P450 4F12-like [Gigantopelta aegis]|uniref:cytochrome P450 4F12-like n=1 Tax=Gigantopelta aegis TaxID=1735272 RepID=UPI001B88CCA7|nr:cytochrome P450 4F12-like [Gigantopelta aegis]XP_041377586.1 cytochrome P450 4F12-like [Gigantopelta aegis]
MSGILVLIFPLLLKAVSILLVTLFCIKLVKRILRYRKYFSFFNSIPGETDFHPIWGNMHKVGNTTEVRIKYVNGLMQKHPQLFRFWVGPFIPVIVLNHPDTIKKLLKTSEPKPLTYHMALPWLGEGLLLAGGERWARSRRLLTPAFHFDILKPYVDIYNKTADVLLDKIEHYSKTGESFELFSMISLCTLDIILKCAMSYDNDVQLKGESHPYVKAVYELSELWFERGRNPLLYPDWIYQWTKGGRRFLKQCKFVHSISEDIIEKRRQTLLEKRKESSSKRYLDFLDILLTAKDENGVGLTPLEIRNEVDTFLFEGHDTTASATSWILYSMATNPEIQREVQAEVDSVLEQRHHHRVEWNDLSHFEYLTRVIKEGLRMHCPVPFVQRYLTEPLEVDGITIPTGTMCSAHIMNLHHNPTVWEDPSEFRPDRFLPQNTNSKDHYAFLPFSAGPRNCIGQHFAMNEEKVILARILHRYSLELDTSHKVAKRFAAVMRSEEGIHVFAKPRIKGNN